MSIESQLLASNISTESGNSDFSYTEKGKAAGYHRKSDTVHTVVYSVNSFSGTIKMQGTLELSPGDNDWVDITGSEVGGDSTTLINPTDPTSIENFSSTFTGNFVWLRAAYNIQNGTIVEIRYNY